MSRRGATHVFNELGVRQHQKIVEGVVELDLRPLRFVDEVLQVIFQLLRSRQQTA